MTDSIAPPEVRQFWAHVTFEGWVSGTTIREAATAARASRIEQLIADGHEFEEPTYD